MSETLIDPTRSRELPPPVTGVWEAPLAPFLERHSVFLCLCFVVIACTRIISSYSALSLTVDEPWSLASGMGYLARHSYQIEPVHPPLSRMMVALGPYLIGAKPSGATYPGLEGINIIAQSKNPNRTIFLMRLGTLPFFILACFVVYRWGLIFGRPLAVMALALFTLLPGVLADAGLATTDSALGATVGAAFLAAILWSERPSFFNAAIMGLALATACLSKFSALGYIPAASFFVLASYVAVRGRRFGALREWARQRATTFLFAMIIMAVVIWAVYLFSLGRFQTHGIDIRLPAPEFFEGIRGTLHHARIGHPAFFLGQFRWKGWWYYFPLVLILKLPIALLILSATGLWVCVRRRANSSYLMPLAFSAGILLPAMAGRIDIGIRHIEPIYIGLSLVAALGLKHMIQWARTGLNSALTAGVLMGWIVMSVAAKHPDYLAYFNAFAGGAPEKLVVDSNYDWGQDLVLLAARLHGLGIHEFSMASVDGVSGTAIGVHELPHYEYLQAWYGLPAIKDLNVCSPSPGWNVLSPTVMKSWSRWPGIRWSRPDGTTPWFEQIAPTERVGPLLLYNVPANSKLNCKQ